MIRLTPTQDADFCDRILNHPDVLMRIRRDTDPEALTVRQELANPRNVGFAVTRDELPQGFWLVIDKGCGVYEFHTNFLRSMRGVEVIRAGRLAMESMFMATPCERLVTFVPACIPEAAAMAKACGFKHDFTQPKAWLRDGVKHDVGHWSLSIVDWLWQRQADYRTAGVKFHDALEAAIGHEPHADDDLHDGIVGLCLTMGARFDNPHKATQLYNIACGQTGYQRVAYLGHRPEGHVFDMGSGIVCMDRNMEVRSVLKR